MEDIYRSDGTFVIHKDHLEHVSDVYDYMQGIFENWFYKDNQLNRILTPELIRDFLMYHFNHLKSIGWIKYIGPIEVEQDAEDGSWNVKYSFHDTDPYPQMLFCFEWNSRSRTYIAQ